MNSISDDNAETCDNLSMADPVERVFIDINGNLSYITQSATVLDVLGNEDLTNDINMKIKT